VARSFRYDAPGWGVGELWLEDEVLVHHELPAARVEPSRAQHPLGERFAAYFAGDDVSFEDVEVDVDGWTPFQRALCAALRSVPRGDVVTYGELAALAGRPGAARAAGTFCAGNRFSIVVPCHRVVAAGGLGSYGSLGLAYKRRLLELEGAALD
jgi:methylated-DNA-[protein]-cysteine S-methyltransferase